MVAEAAPEEDVQAEEAAPRRTRMRMTRGPVIIRVVRAPESADGRVARVTTDRVEKTLPVRVAAVAEAPADRAVAQDWVMAAGPRRASGPR